MAKKTFDATKRHTTALALRNGCLITSTTIQSKDEGDDDLKETIQEEVRHTMRLAHDLEGNCETLQEFTKALLDIVGMDSAGANIIVNTLNSMGTLVSASVSALASVPPPEISTYRLGEALAAYTESVECRREIHKNVSDGMPDSLKPGAPFYPFLEYMRLQGGAACKAEAMARISLYVASDHAENDLTGPLPENEEEREDILRLRDVFSRVRADAKDVSARELKDTMDAVFDRRFVAVKVNSEQNPEGGKVHLGVSPAGKGGLLERDGEGKPVGSGFIDLAIRNAYDASQWQFGVVTSMDTSERQQDQLPRHVQAVMESIERAIPPFSVGDTVRSITFCSSALLYSDTEEARQLAAELISALGGLTADERAQLNAMTHISILDSIKKPLEASPGFVLQADHLVHGGISSHIGGMGRSIQSAVNLAAKNVAAVLGILAERGGQLRGHSDAEERAFDSTLRAARGLCASFANQTEALAPLLAAKPFVEQISEARMMRGWNDDAWSDLASKMSADTLEKKAKRQSVVQAALLPGRVDTLDRYGKATLAAMPKEQKMAQHIARSLETGVLDARSDDSRISMMRSFARYASPRFVDALIARHIPGPSVLWNAKLNGRSLRHHSGASQDEWLSQYLLDKGVVESSVIAEGVPVVPPTGRPRGSRNGGR